MWCLRSDSLECILSEVKLAPLFRRSCQDTGNFGLDLVSSCSLKLFWRGIFASRNTDCIDRIFGSSKSSRDMDSDNYHGVDLLAWLAVGMGTNRIDHCANPAARID